MKTFKISVSVKKGEDTKKYEISVDKSEYDILIDSLEAVKSGERDCLWDALEAYGDFGFRP